MLYANRKFTVCVVNSTKFLRWQSNSIEWELTIKFKELSFQQGNLKIMVETEEKFLGCISSV